MRRRAVWLAVALALVSFSASWAQQGTGRPKGDPEETAPKTVTLDLKNVPLADAVQQIIAKTDLSVIRLGALPAEPRVTMRLEDADPVTVLSLLAQMGQLQFQGQQGYRGRYVVAIGPKPGTPVPPPGRNPAVLQREGGAGVTALAPPALPEEITNLTADLEAKDMPFREAIETINKQIPETARTRIVVDASVPNDVRVTARLHKMPLGWVLGNLVQQADLTYSIQDEPDPEVVAVAEGRFKAGVAGRAEVNATIAQAPRVHTIYIVPRPELSVGRARAGG